MKRYIKSSTENTYTWEESRTELEFDGETSSLPTYEKYFGDSGYMVVVIPEYEERTKILGWQVLLFYYNDVVKNFDGFESPQEAKDFADTDLYDFYRKYYMN